MNDHSHRWRIPEPEGPVSVGRCRECGAEKEFKNSTEDFSYGIGWREIEGIA